MEVQVLLFASIRDLIGQSTLDLYFPSGATAQAVFDRLTHQYPKLENYRNSILYAVNETYVSRHSPLKSGDHIALIPPVSGG
jgi:sulfur-carrier protein